MGKAVKKIAKIALPIAAITAPMWLPALAAAPAAAPALGTGLGVSTTGAGLTGLADLAAGGLAASATTGGGLGLVAPAAVGGGLSNLAGIAAGGLGAGLASGVGLAAPASFASPALFPGAFPTASAGFAGAGASPLGQPSVTSAVPGFGSSLAAPTPSAGGFWNSVSDMARNFLPGSGQTSPISQALNIWSGIQGQMEADEIKKLAQRAGQQSDPFGPYRGVYGQRLAALEANPSSLTGTPGYQFQLEQGMEAIRRRMGASGYGGSGQEGLAMQQFAQDYASQSLQAERARLAQLAGAGLNPASAAALEMQGTLSGAELASRSLASLGYAFGPRPTY